MSAEELLDALDPEQRQVALALTGPVCVLAGAGTGKTRAITHRIAYGVRVGAYSPQTVLAVTFTARAAGEMRLRLRDLGVPGAQARTFHAAALRQLSYFWPEVVGGQIPRLIEHKASLVGSAAQTLGMNLDRLAIRDVSSEIEWTKVSLIAPEHYAEEIKATRRELPAGLDVEQVVDLLRAYEQVKTDSVVLDFEDVLLLLADIIARHPQVSDQIRRQYRHFVVDEYQDVSPLQQYLLDQWLGGRDELCVVGDAEQTIYSFAGATPTLLTNFSASYPAATQVRLVRDYRSTPQVVALANTLSRQSGTASLELVAQRPSGPAVQYASFADDDDEAEGIALRIRSLMAEGVAAQDIAVLYRINSQSEAFEDALANQGIGYLVRGGARFFDREDIKQAMLMLRAAALASTEQDKPATVVRGVLRDLGWADEPPAARGAIRDKWDALQAIVGIADQWNGTYREFVQNLMERAAAQHAPTVDGVTLSTIHAAKGLEWRAVFVVGLSEGLLPISMAEGAAAIAEEKRLLYVAVTRAQEHLTLSYARGKGGKSRRQPTRFLSGFTATGAKPRVKSGRAAPSTEGFTSQDRLLLDELKQWRLGVADGKPAYTVLPDVTLLEIVQRKPRSLSELEQVRGIGPTKLLAYGDDVIHLVEEFTA